MGENGEGEREREGGRLEVRRLSAVCLSLLSPRDGPGGNEGVKYSGKVQERRTFSDVKQLQRWDATRGTPLLLKNPSVCFDIHLKQRNTDFAENLVLKNIHLSVMQILRQSLMNVG